MKKVVVTGANGQLGKCLQDYVATQKNKIYQFQFLTREQFDVTNKEMVESYLFTNKIDCLVNCAAYTAVDLAESEVEKAFKINADAVGYLANECLEQNAKFIHVSTDYVFDGESSQGLVEADFTQPINVYGKSKLEGERLAMDFNPNSIIIRTSWLYSQYGKNFVTTMLRLFKEKKEISVVNDQLGSPTNANDLAKAIYEIVTSKSWIPGVYHYSNQGETNWFEFAQEIKNITKSSIQIKEITTAEFPTQARRPQYSVLDTEKIQKAFDLVIPQWQESLQGLLKMINFDIDSKV